MIDGGNRQRQTAKHAQLRASGRMAMTGSLIRSFVEAGMATNRKRFADRLVGEHYIERVDLMKIDTEIMEPAVLSGAMRLLQRDHPPIIAKSYRDVGVKMHWRRFWRHLVITSTC